MKINRTPITGDFTQIRNAVLRDERLSWKARGLLGFLLSHSDNGFTVDADRLAMRGPDGRSAVLAGLKELEVAGYLVRTKHQGDRGLWATEVEVFDHVTPVDASPKADYPTSENRKSVATAKPLVAPEADYPTSENPTAGSPNVGSSDVGKPAAKRRTPRKNTKKNISHSSETSSPPRSSGDFDAFWKAYPRRVGKQAAAKAYANAVKNADPAALLVGAQRYAAARQGEDPHYTAHPATWLNAGRWDDEPDPLPGNDLTAEQVDQLLGPDRESYDCPREIETGPPAQRQAWYRDEGNRRLERRRAEAAQRQNGHRPRGYQSYANPVDQNEYDAPLHPPHHPRSRQWQASRWHGGEKRDPETGQAWEQ